MSQSSTNLSFFFTPKIKSTTSGLHKHERITSKVLHIFRTFDMTFNTGISSPSIPPFGFGKGVR